MRAFARGEMKTCPPGARVCAPRRLSDCSDQLVGERNLAYTQSHSGPYVPHKRKQGIKRKTLEIQLVCDSITPYGRTIMVCTRMRSTRETKFGRSHQSQDTGLTIVSPLGCYLVVSAIFLQPKMFQTAVQRVGSGKRPSSLGHVESIWKVVVRTTQNPHLCQLYLPTPWPKRVSDYQPHG